MKWNDERIKPGLAEIEAAIQLEQMDSALVMIHKRMAFLALYNLAEDGFVVAPQAKLSDGQYISLASRWHKAALYDMASRGEIVSPATKMSAELLFLVAKFFELFSEDAQHHRVSPGMIGFLSGSIASAATVLLGHTQNIYANAKKFEDLQDGLRRGQAATASAKTDAWHPAALKIGAKLCAADLGVSSEDIADEIDRNVSDAPKRRQIYDTVLAWRRPGGRLPPRQTGAGK